MIDQYTRVLTGSGFVPLHMLVSTPIIRECIKINLSNGRSIITTPEYPHYVEDGEYIREYARDLRPGDVMLTELPMWETGRIRIKNPYDAGFYCGDGHLDRGRCYIRLYTDSKKACFGISKNQTATIRVDVDPCKNHVPASNVYFGDRIQWLAGLIDSDGSLERGTVISISSVNKAFLEYVAELCDSLGIISKIQIAKRAQTKIINGTLFVCKECWRIRFHIPDYLDIPTRRVQYQHSPNYKSIDVLSVEDAGYRGVAPAIWRPFAAGIRW